MAATNTDTTRKLMKIIEPLVTAAGGRCWLENGSAHGRAKLRVEIGGQTRFTPVSCSPRTTDQAIKYKVSDVKRLIREMQEKQNAASES